MLRNRIMFEAEAHLPRPPAPPASPLSFVLCPISWPGSATPEEWQGRLNVYRLAFEIAQQVATPSLPERDLAGVWN